MKAFDQMHVLVVGPSKSLGGIASVIRIHRTTRLWSAAHCRILSTYDERSTLLKIGAIFRAYLLAPLLIHRAGLVHFHVAAQKSILRKTPLILLAKLMRKPYIVHVHAASEESLFKKTPQWIVRMTFLLSYRVVVLSERWAAAVKSHVPGVRVAIVHNPVLIPRTVLKSDGDATLILFVGKLEARKGYKEFLQAATQVLKLYPDVTFRLVGNGEVEEARRYATSLGIEASVALTGWVSADDMEQHYREASMFCLPSHDEGLPMAVLEAMSYGLPVVVTPVGGLPDLVTHGRNGLFADVGDVAAIASQLTSLISQPDLRTSLGAAAALTISRECGVDRIEKQLGMLYREIDAEWETRRNGLREEAAAAMAQAEAGDGLSS